MATVAMDGQDLLITKDLYVADAVNLAWQVTDDELCSINARQSSLVAFCDGQEQAGCGCSRWAALWRSSSDPVSSRSWHSASCPQESFDSWNCLIQSGRSNDGNLHDYYLQPGCAPQKRSNGFKCWPMDLNPNLGSHA